MKRLPFIPHSLSLSLCAVLCICAMLPILLFAQQSGAISGNVTDAGGKAIPKATVVVQSATGSMSLQTISDLQGHYEILMELRKKQL